MTERDELLLRVCQQPSDDFPRLLFADWCDGNGDPERAEFIRLQCLFASRYPPSIDDRLHCTKPFRAGVNMTSIAGVPKGTPMAICGVCEVCRDMARLRQRELELLHCHEREWMGEIGPHAWVNPSPYNESRTCWVTNNATTWIAPKWERGWIAKITCEAAQWLNHGPAIVRQQPITRVVLSDAHVHQDYANESYFVSERILFPREYWNQLENLPSRAAALDAHNRVALLWARQEAGLEPLNTKQPCN